MTFSDRNQYKKYLTLQLLEMRVWKRNGGLLTIRPHTTRHPACTHHFLVPMIFSLSYTDTKRTSTLNEKNNGALLSHPFQERSCNALMTDGNRWHLQSSLAFQTEFNVSGTDYQLVKRRPVECGPANP